MADPKTAVSKALVRIPSSAFIITSHFDGARSGAAARWVQVCSLTPPMVTISVLKGHFIAAIIRDSHRFALCQLARGDRATYRRFENPLPPRHDPFIGSASRPTPAGQPVVDRAIAYLDCELARHVDIESDHELYVGLVTSARILTDDEPELFTHLDGTRRAEA